VATSQDRTPRLEPNH